MWSGSGSGLFSCEFHRLLQLQGNLFAHKLDVLLGQNAVVQHILLQIGQAVLFDLLFRHGLVPVGALVALKVAPPAVTLDLQDGGSLSGADIVGQLFGRLIDRQGIVALDNPAGMP